MRITRTLSVLAATVVVAGGFSIGGATTASAVPPPISTFTISGNVTFNWSPPSNDALIIVCTPDTTIPDDCGSIAEPGSNMLWLDELVQGATSTSIHVGDQLQAWNAPSDTVEAGYYAFRLVDWDNGIESGLLYGYIGNSEDGGTPPPSWYQSVGRASADATCPAGWTPSWAQWANGGAGGYTCDREEYWDTVTSAWAFRSKD